MKSFVIKPGSFLNGRASFLGDKSIAHRAIILSAISPSITIIKNFPDNQDCLSTIKAFQKLGVKIFLKKNDIETKSLTVIVSGAGLFGLKAPKKPIYVGDSGTTLRIILGILSGQNFSARLIAGKSLSKRPMLRVTAPLRLMGADIKSQGHQVTRSQEEFAPIIIRGSKLKAIEYKMPVASAQVKSALLLAGLYAKGTTKVIDKFKTRDHTEHMLKLFNANIKVKGSNIKIQGNKNLVSPKKIFIPGDISSASFFIILALISKKAKLVLENISLNPTRSGVIKVLKRMGAKIKHLAPNTYNLKYEPMGDILVASSKLKATIVKKNEIPALIDELPILMVAACLAKGKTTFKGIQELRLKETDRIKSMSENLIKMGADISLIKKGKSEDIVIHGIREFKAANLKSFGDHRTAMSLIVAGLVAKGKSRIDDISCINKSFPDFISLVKRVVK